MVNIEADPLDDMILVKLDGVFDWQFSGEVEHAALSVSF